jgi:hypothetical protein
MPVEVTVEPEQHRPTVVRAGKRAIGVFHPPVPLSGSGCGFWRLNPAVAVSGLPTFRQGWFRLCVDITR